MGWSLQKPQIHRYPLCRLTISGICHSGNSNDSSSLALHLLKTNICPFSDIVGLQVPHISFLRHSGTRDTSHHWCAESNSHLSAPELITFRGVFLKEFRIYWDEGPLYFLCSLKHSREEENRKISLSQLCLPRC